MQTVILCGGMGTRLSEETGTKPKPMVEIGDRPIVWHIMKGYAYHGHHDFVLCLGYLGHVIKRYFFDYELLARDFTVQLGKQQINYRDAHHENDWSVTLADTGASTMTGARIKRIERYITGDRFFATYGDGVADVDITKALAFHRHHGKLATVSGVRPSSRFGELIIDERLLITGTCYEYDVSRGYLAEDAPTRPAHLYSACKLALLRVSEQLARQSQATLVWARLFWQYGPHEDERRLVPHVLSTLRRGEDVALRTHGRQVRDFLHVDDVAAALALSTFEAPAGVINIGSGEPTTVRDLTTRIAATLNLGKVDYAPDDTPLTEPAFVCADNSKLKDSVGKPAMESPIY